MVSRDLGGRIVLEDTFCSRIVSNINELWPIVEGLKCWYSEFKGKSMSVFTDNTQVMYMLRKGTSTNATCMSWLGEIILICKIFNN